MSRYDRKKSLDDQLFIFGHGFHAVVPALTLSLEENNSLVVRSALEALVNLFPLPIGDLPREFQIALMTGALCALLRRDAALNRRIFQWILHDPIDLQFFQSSAEALIVGMDPN